MSKPAKRGERKIMESPIQRDAGARTEKKKKEKKKRRFLSPPQTGGEDKMRAGDARLGSSPARPRFSKFPVFSPCSPFPRLFSPLPPFSRRFSTEGASAEETTCSGPIPETQNHNLQAHTVRTSKQWLKRIF